MSRIEHKLKTGEMVVIDNTLVCSKCRGDCGQCGLTDVAGTRIPSHLYPKYHQRFYHVERYDWSWLKPIGRLLGDVILPIVIVIALGTAILTVSLIVKAQGGVQ